LKHTGSVFIGKDLLKYARQFSDWQISHHSKE